jgi:multiple sugar transport system ATP-binding protein
MLQLQAISKNFGKVQVLQSIDLSVAQGEFVSLLGPSGCGKTTLLRIIAGLETASSGQALINGREVSRLDPADRNIAMVFQSYALYPHKTVAENIAFPLRMRAPRQTRVPLLGRFSRAGKDLQKLLRQKIPQVAEALNLQGLLERKPAQLSGGQKQRVALARALVRDPLLFLMDEPLSNLDAKLRAETRGEITGLHRKTQGTFIYVTHDQTEAMTMSERIVLLNQGVIQQIGKPLELYDNPGGLFTASFIGSPKINILPCGGSEDCLRIGRHFMGSPAAGSLALGLCCAPAPAEHVGLRAEALRPCASEHADAIPGRVSLLEHMGNETIVYLDIELPPRQRLNMRVGRREGGRLSVGDNIAVRPDWSRALFFDSRGRRLRPESLRPASLPLLTAVAV